MKTISYKFSVDVTNSGELLEYDTWYLLFNALCDANGCAETYELAHRICKNGGKSTQRDVESSARNIVNWQNGSNVPNRKNFRILSTVLKINQDKELLAVWNKLYSDAKNPTESENDFATAEKSETSSQNLFGIEKRKAFGMAIGALLILISGLAWFLDSYLFTPKPIPQNWKDNYVSWQKQVSLKVGEEIVVHGFRSRCGQIPPDAEEAKSRFPKSLKTGKLLAGGMGVRFSRHCKGTTPIREVIFKAERPGTEIFTVFGDDIKVTVLK